MKMTEMFLSQLDAEAPRTRRALEKMPADHGDWKPHEKSMPLGRLAGMIAGMPSWTAMIINQDELDLSPPGGSRNSPPASPTSETLVKSLDEGVAQARAALKGTTDEHLMKPWKLLVAGQVVDEKPRHIVLRDHFMHLAHHRGQLTVYLRLNEAPVPAIYGPSADDSKFA